MTSTSKPPAVQIMIPADQTSTPNNNPSPTPESQTPKMTDIMAQSSQAQPFTQPFVSKWASRYRGVSGQEKENLPLTFQPAIAELPS
jgi:hypothetical protein